MTPLRADLDDETGVTVKSPASRLLLLNIGPGKRSAQTAKLPEASGIKAARSRLGKRRGGNAREPGGDTPRRQSDKIHTFAYGAFPGCRIGDNCFPKALRETPIRLIGIPERTCP